MCRDILLGAAIAWLISLPLPGGDAVAQKAPGEYTFPPPPRQSPTVPPAARSRPPVVQPGENFYDIMRHRQEYYDRVGTQRGSRYKQYMRGQEFSAPRLYPSGNLVNIAALTWLNYLRAARGQQADGARQAAIAAGISTGDWHLIGPTQAYQQAEGGDIGRINAIAFHPEPQTIYVGTPIGGLWRTRDGGGSWTSLTDGLPEIGVSDIAIDPLTPTTVYLLTGDGEAGESMHGPPSIGLLKSTDDGAHWLATGLIWRTTQRQYAHRLAIHPTAPAILFVASSAGLLRTADAGQTWRVVLPAATNNTIWDVLFGPADPSVVYAASSTEVYRSLDGGESWMHLAGALPSFPDQNDPNVSDRIRLGVTPASPTTLYVLFGSRQGFTNGLYRSDDRGEHFSKQSSTTPLSTDPSAPLPIDLTKPNVLGWDPNDFGSQSDYDLSLAVSPTNVDRVHVGGVNTWRSDDGGRTWQLTSRWQDRGWPNYTHADIHMLAYRGETLYAATDGGLYRSIDAGESWRSIADMQSGIAIAQVYSVCATPQDPDLFYYGAQDNGTFRLRTNGEIQNVYGGDGVVCQINPKDSRVVYASYVNGDIHRSDDGGQNFQPTPITPKVGGRPIPGPWLTPYILGPDDPDNVYACYADLWKSPDRGFSWSNLTNGALGSSIQCQQVAIGASDPKTIYVAKQSTRGRNIADARTPFLGGGGVFRSTDGGTTWQTITGTLPLADAAITNLAVSPTDSRRVWVTFSGYSAGIKIFTSIDGGTTWTNISDGLPNLPVSAVAAKNGPANGVFVGLDSGVYYRDDRLNAWVPFSDGLPNVVVVTLVIDEERGRLIAGTFGRGVWITAINPATTAPGTRGFASSAAPRPPRGTFVGSAEIFEAAH